MKRSLLLPLAILLAGIAIYFWQGQQLRDLRVEETPASTGPAATSAGSLSETAQSLAKPPEAETGQKPPSAKITGDQAVDMASLTDGLEYSLDLSKGGEQLLGTSILAKIGNLSPEQVRATFAAVTRILAQIDPKELQRGKASNPEHMRAMILFSAFTGRMQRDDPRALLKWMADPATPEFFRQQAGRFAEATMANFAQQEPAAALAWLEANATSVPEPERLLPVALAGLAKQDFPGALRKAEDRGVVAEMLKAVVPSLTTPDLRRQWAEAVGTIPEEDRRGRRWTSLIDEQVRTAGWEAAFQVMAEELPAEARTKENTLAVINAALTDAPAQLAEKLAGLPASTASEVIPELVHRWTERDYNAAAAWLGRVPENAPWRDAAVAALVGQIGSLDPDAARVWSATIKDSKIRAKLQP